jgi:hypothetical protein
MQLLYNAFMHWYSHDEPVVVNDSGLPSNVDSAAPGGVKEGFGLRSPYLPGVRRFWAEPTYQSCCSKPIPNTPENEYPNPSRFRVLGFAVAPTVRPRDMNLPTLTSDLRHACEDLHWIVDASVCQLLRARLGDVAGLLQRHDRTAAISALSRFLDDLERQHRLATKPVNNNAYWLLKVNAEYLRSHL